MRHTGSLLCLAASIAHAASDGPRPRGVGPEFAKFFKKAKTFTCISNPSIQIPYSRVNDDFCDCPDGSDEPGTAACSYLSPLSPSSPADTTIADLINSTLALPGFYCKNKGHQPSYLPFTAVNDGVCDYSLCCDGSEEYSGIVKCEDRCAEIGKEARKVAETRQATLTAALRKRKELVADAARLRKEVEDFIADMKIQIGGSESLVEQLKVQLEEVEAAERNKVVKSAGSGELAILVGQAQARTRELRESLIRVKEERDSNKERLQELEELLTTFKEEYNPNFNDEGVKRAVRAWEDYAARDKDPEPEAAKERDLTEIIKTDEEYGLNWDDFDKVSASEVEGTPELDLLYSFEAYLPPSLRSWVDTQLRALRQTLIDNGILANKPASSSSSSPAGNEPKAVADARTALSSAESALRSLHKDIEKHESDLATDHGPEDVFRPLKNQCISTESGEFNYEVCFMGKTTQRSKKGGGTTSLGNFAEFTTVDVDDDEDKPDGRSLGKGRRLAMKFSGGQHCWNGPNRSTTVVMACAEKDELWKIVEEEKCVYRMEVGTPAVCGFDGDVQTHGPEGEGEKVEGINRDEL